MNKQVIDANQWVDLYGDLMYRYTLVRVKDQGAAEEIVQVTFLAALQATHTYAGRSSEKSWLFGILKHKILDHFREIKKNRSYDLSPEDDQDPCEYGPAGHWKKMPQNWRLDPEKSAVNQELTEKLALCLDGLSDKFRQIFVLKEIDGVDTEQICKEFDIKPTNLWVILHRARNQLKNCLEIHWFNGKKLDS
jgi:RNA polymerase sigma-70 factor (TIGR02943 family)